MQVQQRVHKGAKPDLGQRGIQGGLHCGGEEGAVKTGKTSSLPARSAGDGAGTGAAARTGLLQVPSRRIGGDDEDTLRLVHDGQAGEEIRVWPLLQRLEHAQLVLAALGHHHTTRAVSDLVVALHHHRIVAARTHGGCLGKSGGVMQPGKLAKTRTGTRRRGPTTP